MGITTDNRVFGRRQRMVGRRDICSGAESVPLGPGAGICEDAEDVGGRRGNLG